MCCLYGFIDYGHKLTRKQRLRLLSTLSTACEVRGTDATGIAYNLDGKQVRYGVSVFMNQRIYTFLMTAGSAAGSLSSMMLQHCTPEEQRYAEEILKTFIMAMNSKHE